METISHTHTVLLIFILILKEISYVSCFVQTFLPTRSGEVCGWLYLGVSVHDCSWPSSMGSPEPRLLPILNPARTTQVIMVLACRASILFRNHQRVGQWGLAILAEEENQSLTEEPANQGRYHLRNTMR